MINGNEKYYMHNSVSILGNIPSRHIIASELRERVIEAHKAGMRNKDIAEKFNTSKSNVTKIIKTYE